MKINKEIKLIIKAIQELVEDSDVITDIKNDLFDVQQQQKYDHDHAMELSEKVNDLHYDIQDDLDSLQQQIDELKDALDDLKEKG
jgi:uncharacterized coiled-coil DUF342 family protein